MTTWINLLHIYQPPYQDKEVLKNISQESYGKILDILEQHPKAKITLNIQGCLTEQLIENNLSNILERIKKLAQQGQIEFTGSAKFHPILPLIPEQEAVRQIELNNKINKEVFGEDIYQPKGFFLPEMAYSREVAKIIYNLGFKWIILDEISYSSFLSSRGGETTTKDSLDYQKKLEIKISPPEADLPWAEKLDTKRKYFIRNIGLQIVFRNRQVSKTYVPETILKLAEENPQKNQTIITATDGELYGHYHINQKKFEIALESDIIKTQTISEYLDSIENFEENIRWIDPISSSWESEQDELKQEIPYALWKNPHNPIHQKLWRIAETAITLMEKKQEDRNLFWARKHLDYGLASCTFWWASGKKFHEMSIESWCPEEVNRGVNELLKSVRALDSAPKEAKIEMERLAAEVKKDIWETHWNRIK